MIINSTAIESNRSFVIHRYFDTKQTVRVPVEANDIVSPVQIVAQINRETGYEIVPIAGVFNVNPSDISSYLQVEKGDEVRLGSLLAERRRTFGRSQHITSKVEGTVSEILDGNLFISRKPEDVNLRALVSGRVTQVDHQRGVMIEVQGSRLQGVWSNGLESAGQLRILTDSPEGIATPDILNEDLFGSIIVVGHLDEPSLLDQLADTGVRGVIIGSASPVTFHAAETSNLPFVITDGAGKLGMFPRFFQLLSENSGKDVAIFNGKFSPSGRADIVITHKHSADEQTNYPKIQLRKIEPAIGQPIRVLTGGNQGQTGTIVKLYSWPKPIESGIKSLGADIRFDNGQTIFVPLANLDIIM